MPLKPTGFIKLASKVFKAVGNDVTIRKVTHTSYNPTTASTGEITSDTTIKGFVERVLCHEVGELIRATDKRLTIAAASLTYAPTSEDKIIINSITHKIIRIQTTEQGNSPISYELILRS